MFQIQKSFQFDYGHRVWTQILEQEMALKTECVCRHLHGHRGNVKVTLESDVLNNEGMVMDLVNLNFMKRWIDDYIDHKFLVDSSDPLFETIINQDIISRYGYSVEILDEFVGNTMSVYKTSTNLHVPKKFIDYMDSFVVVNTIPTSENIARLFGQRVQSFLHKFAESYPAMGLEKVRVARIEFYETEKTMAVWVP